MNGSQADGQRGSSRLTCHNGESSDTHILHSFRFHDVVCQCDVRRSTGACIVAIKSDKSVLRCAAEITGIEFAEYRGVGESNGEIIGSLGEETRNGVSQCDIIDISGT